MTRIELIEAMAHETAKRSNLAFNGEESKFGFILLIAPLGTNHTTIASNVDKEEVIKILESFLKQVRTQ